MDSPERSASTNLALDLDGKCGRSADTKTKAIQVTRRRRRGLSPESEVLLPWI